jgi:uncharacterized cupin superfamily protein
MHQRSDGAFCILSGCWALRYGDQLLPLRPGGCVSRSAGTGVAHQVANPCEGELLHLVIGANDPDAVAVYRR